MDIPTFLEIGRVDDTCPHCSLGLAKRPGKKTPCPHCGALIFVKTRRLDRRRVLVTQEEAGSLASEWAQRMIFVPDTYLKAHKAQMKRGRKLALVSQGDGLIMPSLSKEEKPGVVLGWITNWGDVVNAGDVLLVLQTHCGFLSMCAPTSGFLASCYAQIGRVVTDGDYVGRLSHERPNEFRVHVHKVQPPGLPQCLRISYQTGFTLVAREWVCPDADGIAGDMGKRWWLERMGRLPVNIDDALQMATELPPPKAIHATKGDIERIEYSLPLKNGIAIFKGNNSAFLLCEDEREMEECRKSVVLESSYGGHLPAPSWWPRIPGNTIAAGPGGLEIIQRALERSRQLAEINEGLSYTTPSQAARNLSMAYSVHESPLPEEILCFARRPYDRVIPHHPDQFKDKLRSMADASWLQRVIGPLQDNDQARLRSGLVFCAGGYALEDLLLPCQDLVSRCHNDGPFRDAVDVIVRECVDSVRVANGLPRIGEGWITETELYNRVCRMLENEEVIHHGRPPWIGAQHLDIWVPGRRLAIEYQGEQHFYPISFFGGEDGLKAAQERDEKKRRLCAQNGIRLIEVSFEENITDEQLALLISGDKT